MMGQMEPMLAPDERLDVRRCRSARRVGALAGEVLSGTEVGLPLVEAHRRRAAAGQRRARSPRASRST